MFLLFLGCTLLCDDAGKDLASSAKVSTYSLIYDFIAEHDKKKAELFMKNGGDVNTKVSFNNCSTLLHNAIGWNDLRLIEALLKKGGDVLMLKIVVNIQLYS